MSADALASMSAPEVPCQSRAAPSIPLARWVALATLLVAEVLLLTVRFDTATLGNNTAWWALLLGASGLWLRLAIAVVAATWLISGRGLGKELRRLHAGLDESRRWQAWLLGHGAAYGVLFALTALLLERNLAASAWSAAWFLLWLAAAGLTGVCAALAAMPARLWLPLLYRTRGGLALGGLVGLIAFAASFGTGQWWQVLAQSTFWVVQSILGLFYQNLVCEPGNLVVGTALFQVQIAPECSGYEGMGLISVFTLVYLAVFRQRFRFPHALILLPLGVVVIWWCNAIRLAALIVIGSAGWPDVALGGFHSQAGWLFFNGVALGLVACSGRMRFLTAVSVPIHRDRRRPDRMNAVTTSEADPTLAYLAPFLALLCTRMLAAAFSRAPEVLFPLEVLAALAALAWFRRAYGRLHWTWSWPPLLLGAGTALCWAGWQMLLAPGPRTPPPGALALPAPWASLWGLCRILGYVLVVPVAEELAFRGYLLRRLVAFDFQAVPRTRFTWLSFIVSSILFGALHGANWLPGVLAGMLFALAFYRRGRLGDAIAAHVMANLLLALYGALSNDWSLLS